MKLLHIVGRAALGIPFMILGYGAATAPGGRVAAVEKVGLPRPELLVRVNGGAMVAGGAALAAGILPRAAALGLAASLVPTTLTGHPFWAEDDPGQRAAQRTQFLKNLALTGALLAYVARDND